MMTLTVDDIVAEIEKLRCHYMLVCHPDDIDGIQHALDELDLGGLTTVEVRASHFIDRGTACVMQNVVAEGVGE
jgi:hypothetical protein